MKKFIYIAVVFLFVGMTFSQNLAKQPNYFGFQFKPLIPLSVVGDRPFEIEKDGFTTTVSSRFGYNYGGIVRMGLSRLIAIETGLSYTKRNYQLDYSVPDSNLSATSGVGFVNFDIPANLLVYIRLGREQYMNASLGTSLNFYPSNVRTLTNPEGINLFIFEGRRGGFFSFDINSNVGFEYRTKKSGVFYLGVSGKLPLQPIFIVASEYRYDTQRTVAFGQVEGATFSLDLKYFFHNPPKKGVQYIPGPIEH